jgi:DNA-binding response OmpR family regulator
MIIIRNKILVIDDEPEAVELLKKRLERVGYKVITATDGTDGFKKACEQNPDLILLDIIMPQVDGLEILRKLRAEESTCKTPVIMVTAKGRTDSIFEAERYRATDYIIKPFQWGQLLRFIKRYLVLYEKHQK